MLTRDDLAGLARAACGPGRRLTGVSRLRGGSKKGVYRLAFDDDFSAIAYVWAPEEDYWPAARAVSPADSLDDPFAHASGLALFEAAHRELDAAGVRVPRVYLSDRSGRRYPADAAVVEDLPGENLEARLDRDPRSGDAALAGLARALEAMHRRQAPRYGKVAAVQDRGVTPAAGRGSCEQVVLDRAQVDLAEAASRDQRIGRVRPALEALLLELAAGVRPRAEYRLVHGELGPDHVLLSRAGEPVLIDIEGLMFFDVEWEHVFLRIRFGSQYRWLARPGLDERRLSFYTLATRLSLVAGPLRLLDGDFPERAGMLEIAEYNLRATLDLLEA